MQRYRYRSAQRPGCECSATSSIPVGSDQSSRQLRRRLGIDHQRTVVLSLVIVPREGDALTPALPVIPSEVSNIKVDYQPNDGESRP